MAKSRGGFRCVGLGGICFCTLAIFLLSDFISRVSVLAIGNELELEGFDDSEDFEADDSFSHTTTFLPPITLTVSTPLTPDDPLPPPPPPPPPPPVVVEHWDEDEFEGIPQHQPLEEEHISLSDPDDVTEVETKKRKEEFSPKSYGIEIACLIFLLVYTVNFFLGKRENENIALAWAVIFSTKDSIFAKNFSILSSGSDGDVEMPLLLKESNDTFKFYASGRRFCQGLIGTIELRRRHDLIWRVIDLVAGKEDTVGFEVFMNDEAMDQVVFAVARKKVGKVMMREERDLQRYAGVIAVAPGGRKWVAEELAVVSESKEVAGDLLTDTALDQAFGDKAFEKLGKGFILLHFSDQHLGSHKKILKFSFSLPNPEHMAEISRLMALVPYYVDLVGRYKLSSQARSKTEAARAKAAQEAHKELQNARQEALQKKKMEKRKLLEDFETKITAEAIRKMEEKDRAHPVKKSGSKVKTLRSH